MTLSEFRSLLSARPGQHPDAILRRADRLFFELLALQAREAAARQSLDRLAGWTKAAQARLDAESAPMLDVDMLRFAEAKAAARLERFEAARLSSVSEANRLFGRDSGSPLLVLADEPSQSLSPALRSQQELLTQAQELLAKMYQNYLFGGITLTTLLWQEEQTYQTELQYRLLLADTERSRTVSD